MFGKRRTSQKPNESFIRDFQRQFGSVATRSYSPQAPFQGGTDHHESQDDHRSDGMSIDHSAVNFLSPITRQNCSCSVLDNRMCTVLHSPAGDLHTPAHECSASIWGNRISNFDPPQDDSLVDSGAGSSDPLQSDSRYPSHHFHTINPVFSELTDSPEPLLRRHSEYDSLGLMQGNLFPQGTVDPLQITSLPVDMASDRADLSHTNTNMEPRGTLPQDPEAFDRHHLARAPESPSLRYRVTLHAPTATFHQTRDIPVTYLNRCQPYLISVTDTRPPAFRAHPTRYRTYVRISFDNAAQREDPVSSWRLWRDGRGLHEARKRDGRLSAVEFVNVRNDGFRSEGAAHVQLLSSSFDGFCVQWTVDPHAVRVGCEMHVAFNCLSTDFSLSKGVKGAALRLCAKTELVSVDQAPMLMAHQPNVPEICYCKVKVFRDHGAERKLSNDTIHLRRAIRKMEEKIAEAEFYNTKGPGKKKRVRTRASELLDSVDAEPGGSSSSSSGGSRVPRRAHSFSTGEDLYQELFDLRKVFSSSQPTSVLSLRGSEQDDPDLFPVELSSGATSPRTMGRSGTQGELPSEMKTEEWMEMVHDDYSAQSEATQSSMQTPTNDPGSTLENVNVPIRSRPGQGKAVACFYVLSRHDGQTDEYYRALYLMERTVSNLKSQLSKVRDTTAEHIARLIRINPAGLRIMIDDTVVQEIPEGQDMIAEFREGDGTDIPAEDFEVVLFF